MAFGRLGALGGGFGRLGAGAGAGVSVSGGAALLVGEQNAIGVDFSHATDAERVAVKTAGVVVNYGLDTFIQNGSTGPKLVTDAVGLLEWTPHNMFLNSAVPATQTVTTITGATYTVTVTGTGSLTGSSGAAGVATAGAPLTYVATGTSSIFTLAGSLTTIQMNLGRVATAYLETVGTRRFGLAIDYDATLGPTLLSEASITALALWNSDFTNAVWVKSNMTTAFTATGPTNAVNSATTLTATAANATVLQAITSGSSLRGTCVYLKRRTGSGNIDLTQDNGSTWATQTITSSWARYTVAEATLTNPTVGIRIVTSGDAVDVALFQHCIYITGLSNFTTSPIPTFSAAVSRAADNYTFLLSTIPSLGSEYSMYVRFAVQTTGYTLCPVVLGDGTLNEQSKFIGVSGAIRLIVVDGGVTGGSVIGSAMSVNTLYSAAGRFKLNDCAMSTNGAAVATDVAVTMPTVTSAWLGTTGTAVAGNTTRLTKLVIVTDRGWSNAELLVKSAS